MASTTMDPNLKKRVRGWMMFDFATQPYHTLLVTFIFGPYFAAVATAYYAGFGHDTAQADAMAQSVWFWGQTASGLFIAFSAPILGAYADTNGGRMRWIWVSSIIYFISSMLLWFMFPDGSQIFQMLIVFNIGFVAAEMALVFVNSMLPDLTENGEHDVGQVSGTGVAVGYFGGVIALFITLFFFAENDAGKTLLGISPLFGLDAELREGTRFVGPLTAIWFAVFMIPFFAWVREPKPQKRGDMGLALAGLKKSLVAAYHRPSLRNFLIGSMLYRDGLNALYVAGGFYMALILEWSVIETGVFGIIGAITATIAAYIGGRCDKRFGPKPVINVSICILIVVTFAMIAVNREHAFGIALAQGSKVPDIIFYICGACVGGTGGTIYSASRSLMVRHIEPGKPVEGFGLFALSGKATAFLAPFAIALATWLSGNTQIGFSPVILLLAIGLFLLRYVQADGDQA